MTIIILYPIFREKALNNLISLAIGVKSRYASFKLIEEAMIVFDNVTESILADQEQFICCDMKYNYLPQFLIEWITCRAWFLYLTQNVQTSVAMLKVVIGKIQNIIKINNYEENQ